ncbi:OLC1v1021644C3 [Oldenlandia corymbosa var. corymbosa]|nr:OLC1v1021644C3 [Oldenlandia corymbosa var. corymbosa]
MAKRGYKLQEFVAHSGSVNCLKIGKKNFRQFLTGGDDQIVNLWSIGKPEPVTSLSGHTSPVESVAFDSAEVLVVAGASSGAIKLWDLEETKMVRSLSGHRSYCTAVEFHPFGEFFASGSMDTNLKLWDIRKKGCIHTYKGHTRGISTIRFTPDGRWVVSGGFDNVVKIWDLTAGKPLHDFKHHEGHIRSLDFHPLEFLLATGSADRTVKFWDLETFELIGSAKRESAGVRSITFHPDGRTLFCGLDDSLKVYSWEPVICHDSVDMGWSTLGDLCIHDGKLLGAAYYQNSVGVWVADVAFIEPYGAAVSPGQNTQLEQKDELQENVPEKSDSHRRSISSMHSTSDVDSGDIKNIYVDSCNSIISTNVGSLSSPKTAVLSEKNEIRNLSNQKQRSGVDMPAKTNVSASAKSFTVPSIIPRDIPETNDVVSSRGESFAGVRASSGIVKPSHVRRPSITKSDMDNSTPPDPLSLHNMTSKVDPKKDPNLTVTLVRDNAAMESSVEFDMSIKNVQEDSVKASAQTRPSQENGEKAQDLNQGMVPVKVVNGVAVVRGRTRSLVERFEKKEVFSCIDVQPPGRAPEPTTEAVKMSPQVPDEVRNLTTQANKTSPPVPDRAPDPAIEAVKTSSRVPDKVPYLTTEANEASPRVPDTAPNPLNEEVKIFLPVDSEVPYHTSEATETSPPVPDRVTQPATEAVKPSSPIPGREPQPATEAVKPSRPVPDRVRHRMTEASEASLPLPDRVPRSITVAAKPYRRVPDRVRYRTTEAGEASPLVPDRVPHTRTETGRPSRLVPDRVRYRTAEAPKASSPVPDRASYYRSEAARTSLPMPDGASHHTTEALKTASLIDNQLSDGKQESNVEDNHIIEALMENHDVLLSALRSRLTKLQMVRHFWERKDVKGAINVLKKLPDHSVQADVISVLTEKMEIINLDLFSCVLPVLLGLLDSKVERHVSTSLEMLLKLIAVFGPLVHSTVSAPGTIGVDLHAEERRASCKQCHVYLQNVQKILPMLIQ